MRPRPAACRIAGVPGSLRAGSYNRGLLAAAQRMAPPWVEIDVVDVGALPPYNADLQSAGGDPRVVSWLKQIIGLADGVLIATPEYNLSIPGFLKNAIDWISCPPARSALRNKPVAVMGATVGPFGTAQAQSDLRRILKAAGAVVLEEPPVMVSLAPGLFDAEGRLTDEETLQRIAELVTALAARATAWPAPVSLRPAQRATG